MKRICSVGENPPASHGVHERVVPYSQSQQQHQQQRPDFGAMTVVALKERLRGRGLKVSGSKKELIDRLELAEDGRPRGASAAVSGEAKDHLAGVVKDIILSSGGSIGSRDLGRFLSKVPPSPKAKRHDNALQELKEHYLSINKFLDRNRDLFEYQQGVGKSVYLSEHGFEIKLAPSQ